MLSGPHSNLHLKMVRNGAISGNLLHRRVLCAVRLSPMVKLV
jgi:hypothetical protein